MFGALRRAIEHQHAKGCRHRIDDADHGFLLQRALIGPHQRHQHRTSHRKRKSVPIGGLARYVVAGKDGDREAEGCDLGQREIDEHDLPRQHMQAELGVDARQDEAGHERP